MRLGFNCSHCGSRANNLSLIRKSPTVWEGVYRCNGNGCGHLFVVEISAIRALHAASVARYGVSIPLARDLLLAHRERRDEIERKARAERAKQHPWRSQ